MYFPRASARSFSDSSVVSALYALPSVFLIAAHSSPRAASASDAIGTKRSAISGASKINLFTKTSKTISYIILNLNVCSYSRVLEFATSLSVTIFWIRQLRMH